MSDNMYKRLLDRSIACNEELVAKLSKSEALLDKAIEELEEIVDDCNPPFRVSHICIRESAQRTVAEITKERSDEKGEKL